MRSLFSRPPPPKIPSTWSPSRRPPTAAVVSPDAHGTPCRPLQSRRPTVLQPRGDRSAPMGRRAAAQPHALRPRPPVAGHLRWVTTSTGSTRRRVAAGLELTLSLNPSLATYDGAKFATSSPWQFTTPKLRVSSARVRSEAALRLTSSTWSSTAHPLARGAHEVPPDGRVVLWFSADVELPLLQAAWLHRTTEAHGLEPSPAPDAEADDAGAASCHHSNHPHHSAVTLAACSPPSAPLPRRRRNSRPASCTPSRCPPAIPHRRRRDDDTTVVLPTSSRSRFRSRTSRSSSQPRDAPKVPPPQSVAPPRPRRRHDRRRPRPAPERHRQGRRSPPVSLSRPSAASHRSKVPSSPIANAFACRRRGVRDGFECRCRRRRRSARRASQFFSRGGTQYGGAVTARFAGTAAPRPTRGDALCLGYPRGGVRGQGREAHRVRRGGRRRRRRRPRVPAGYRG